MSNIQAMNLGKSSCNCSWGDCVGLCSSLEPFPLDEDPGIFERPRAFASFMDSFDFDTLALPNDSINKSSDMEEDKLDEYYAIENAPKRGVEESPSPKSCSQECTPEPLHGSASQVQKKRIKERNRRGDINKGFKELAKLIFVINPDLKETAKKKSSGMIPCADETHLLRRVELVKSAVTTLARLYKDNEVHKMIISHLTSGTAEENKSGSDEMPLFPLLPDVVVSTLSSDDEEDTATTEETIKKSPNLSRTEIKRNREKKRRADIAKGLETLSRMVLIMDPQLKAEAEKRATKLLANGSISTKQSQLLSQTDLVNGVVACLSRIHKENEAHKMLISNLARARRDASSQSSGPIPRNVVSPPLNGDTPAEGIHAQPITSLSGVNLLGDDAGTSRGDEATETLQEQVTLDSLAQAFSPEEALVEVSFPGDEPAPKRMKTCEQWE